ncbi:hypothetical protein FOC4_g10008473 [Fusarium odoratissimum]|uniref:Uncharacterized protein n=3 Tax=Fusarium oxysporum species complex TaxID=171631 RepID=N1S0L0_FUSC4|nr:hypothetical protein FOC4_g10008473 [Fusarium odoratissimum]KAH7202139.1 hypothetical protein DER44DRAFT_749219 [Fusarium oxysporum]
MDLPLQHKVHSSQTDPPGSNFAMASLSIVSWVIGIIVTLGFVILFFKCLMNRRAPRQTAPRPSISGPPIPAPPQGIEGDVELGTTNDRHDKTTKSSTVGDQPRVPPPPYCRRS